jgi:thiol-disulfide isomerase/thioredoxin
VRTDQNLARNSFRFSDSWKKDKAKQQAQPSIDDRLEGFEVREGGKVVVHSLSGNERNRLFMNRGGKEFDNASTISGLDNPADSRGWVWLDYDRDGWQDIAVVNANAPLVNLYHNNIGLIAGGQAGGMIALRFEGGGGPGFSCRDGYGAMVEVKLANGMTLKREHRCGEGYSSQNSATMIIGIGEPSEVASVKVRWPSGKTSSVEGVEEGTLLTAFENRPEGAFAQEAYRHSTAGTVATVAKQKFPIAKSAPENIQIYTTTATWCAACLSHLPALARLKQDGVALYGVPIDPEDDAARLADYVEKRKPPYQMLAEIGDADKQGVNEFLAKELQMQNPVLPSSVITDADGNVLEVMQGIPTLSQVRKWIAAEL